MIIYNAEVDPNAHAGSRGDVPGAKDKVGGHGDFYHDDVPRFGTLTVEVKSLLLLA